MDTLLATAAQLSAHLKSLRKAKGLTQAQFGALIGVGQVRIADIEKHPGAVSVEQLLRVLHALDTQILLKTPSANEPAGPSSQATPAGESW
jgi:HTH-type transcriptional regulator/antitoxin HipB